MTCIHIDHDGTTWVNTPEGIPTQVIGKYRPSKLLATTYRVIAVPQNYKVIISLYLSLINKEIKGNLLVGSPQICRRYHNSSLQLLNCISVLLPAGVPVPPVALPSTINAMPSVELSPIKIFLSGMFTASSPRDRSAGVFPGVTERLILRTTSDIRNSHHRG